MMEVMKFLVFTFCHHFTIEEDLICIVSLQMYHKDPKKVFRLYMYILFCVCVCELSYWWTQTPACLAQVQSAAAPSLEKAAVKVAALRPLVGGGGGGGADGNPTPPLQFVNTVKDSGKHVPQSYTL